MSDVEMLFADLEEGRTYPPFRFSIDADTYRTFRQCVVAGPLQRADGTPVEGSGGAAARRPLSPFVLNNFRAMRAVIKLPNGVLHAREALVLRGAVFEGDELEMVITIKSKYRKNEKNFVLLEQRIARAGEAAPVMSIERTLVWPK
jgi:hypothetical protein